MTTRYDAAIEALEAEACATKFAPTAWALYTALTTLRSLRDKPEERPQQCVELHCQECNAVSWVTVPYEPQRPLLELNGCDKCQGPQQPAAFPPEVVERPVLPTEVHQRARAAAVEAHKREPGNYFEAIHAAGYAFWYVIAEHLRSAEVRESVAETAQEAWKHGPKAKRECWEHVADAVLAAVVGKGGG